MHLTLVSIFVFVTQHMPPTLHDRVTRDSPAFGLQWPAVVFVIPWSRGYALCYFNVSQSCEDAPVRLNHGIDALWCA
jgi:hypothetical protein